MRQKITEKLKSISKAITLFCKSMIHNSLEHKGVCVVSMEVKTNTHFLNQGSKLNLKLTI